MKKNEERFYDLTDEAADTASELERIIRNLRYDPTGASIEDIKAITEVNRLLKKAAALAKETADRLF